jgi:hypothetical protein
MIVKKITVGFVVQSYDTNAKKFIEQNFTAGDQVDWEDEFGDTLSEPATNDYLPFDMVQPQ